MEYIETDGKTMFKLYPKNGTVIFLSIISRRACNFVLNRSINNNWHKKIFSFNEYFEVYGFTIVGFQPENGQLICYAKRRKSNAR